MKILGTLAAMVAAIVVMVSGGITTATSANDGDESTQITAGLDALRWNYDRLQELEPYVIWLLDQSQNNPDCYQNYECQRPLQWYFLEMVYRQASVVLIARDLKALQAQAAQQNAEPQPPEQGQTSGGEQPQQTQVDCGTLQQSIDMTQNNIESSEKVQDRIDSSAGMHDDDSYGSSSWSPVNSSLMSSSTLEQQHMLSEYQSQYASQCS